MALIHVPRPPRSAYNPDRPVSSLLKSQMEHLHEAEKRLPLRYRSDVYVNAIQTEGEAARYIRDVTEAIHAAHEDAARARRVPKRKRGIEIAAAADDPKEQKGASRRVTKRSSKKTAKSSVKTRRRK
jgi:hypothetical protein